MPLNRAASGTSPKKQNKGSQGLLPERPFYTFPTTHRRRTPVAGRQTQMGRLRLSLVGLVVLLIMMMTAWLRTTETMVHRQQTLLTACRSHVLFTYLDSALGDTRVAASDYIRLGTTDQWDRSERSFAEVHKALDAIQKQSLLSQSSQSSVRERYTDLLPRIYLYLKTLKEGVRLRRDRRRQSALTLLSDSDASYARLLPLSLRLRTESESLLAQLTGEIEQEAENLRANMWLWASLVTVILGAAGLFFSRDLKVRTFKEQELRRANRTLTRLAEQDSLTGLKNRRSLEDELHTEWARARRWRTPLSLLIVDVDKFKEYNDTFGHQAGDEALKQVADLLRREERLSGCYVARYGGEEFAVLLPQAEPEEAARIGERVRASFESASWQGRPVRASIGAATLTPGIRGNVSDVETLLYEADGALYQAKREGRNQVVHASDLFPFPATPALPA